MTVTFTISLRSCPAVRCPHSSHLNVFYIKALDTVLSPEEYEHIVILHNHLIRTTRLNLSTMLGAGQIVHTRSSAHCRQMRSAVSPAQFNKLVSFQSYSRRPLSVSNSSSERRTCDVQNKFQLRQLGRFRGTTTDASGNGVLNGVSVISGGQSRTFATVDEAKRLWKSAEAVCFDGRLSCTANIAREC